MEQDRRALAEANGEVQTVATSPASLVGRATGAMAKGSDGRTRMTSKC